MLVINVAFAYSEVFHNAMLPSITPANEPEWCRASLSRWVISAAYR